MNREDHGKARAGCVTASVASTIMRGNAQAWDTLIAQLWADDGSSFADASVGGARAHGLKEESKSLAMFWERNPDRDLQFSPGFCPMEANRAGFNGMSHQLGCSPDAFVMRDYGRIRYAGIEAKNPIERAVFEHYAREIEAGRVPREHEDQVQASIWFMDIPWYFVTQHSGDYRELFVQPDAKWQLRWVDRLRAFLRQYNTGAKPVRDKLGAGAIGDI